MLWLLLGCQSLVGTISGQVTVPGEFNLAVYYAFDEACADVEEMGTGAMDDCWTLNSSETYSYTGSLFYPAAWEMDVYRTVYSDKDFFMAVNWFFYMTKDEDFSRPDSLFCTSLYGDTLDVTIHPDMRTSISVTTLVVNGITCP